MVAQALKPGDMVIYRDQDEVNWGPWEVSDVMGDTVMLVVEEMIQCPAKVTDVRKVQQGVALSDRVM